MHPFSSRAQVSRFPTGEAAYAELCAVGFCSVPSMLKPPEILAPSEAYRAALALAAHGSSGVLRVDEFTSVLDRRLAAAVSVSTARLAQHRRVVVATSWKTMRDRWDRCGLSRFLIWKSAGVLEW